MSPVHVFEEMRLPLELLAAALAFLLPLAEKKERFRQKTVSGIIAAVLFSLLYFVIFGDKEKPRFPGFQAVWYMAVALTAYVYSRYCFRISRSDALFVTIASFLAQNIVYCFYHCCFARVLVPGIRQVLPLYAAGACLCTAIVVFPLYFAFRRPLQECGGSLLNDTKYMYRVLSGLFFLMFVFLFYYQAVFESRVSVFDTAGWISGILVSIFLLLILYAVIRNTLLVRETAVQEALLRSSQQCYELSKEQIAVINRKCHDLKHQIHALEKADQKDREEYIKEVENSIDFYHHLVYTDNEALNTILAEKGLFCQDKDIAFTCAVDDADLSFIRLPDLYALLGNAIDNAIEYTDRQKEKEMRLINMRITKRGQFIGIQVTNPYHGRILAAGELPATSKENAGDHGFGLKSIRWIAQKYGGTMVCSADENLFTLQITIPAG